MVDELLSTAEAARRLGLGHSTVKRLIKVGTLSAQRVGRGWVVRAADLATAPVRPRGRPKNPKQEVE